jgi:hypothetical protein
MGVSNCWIHGRPLFQLPRLKVPTLELCLGPITSDGLSQVMALQLLHPSLEAFNWPNDLMRATAISHTCWSTSYIPGVRPTGGIEAKEARFATESQLTYLLPDTLDYSSGKKKACKTWRRSTVAAENRSSRA